MTTTTISKFNQVLKEQLKIIQSENVMERNNSILWELERWENDEYDLADIYDVCELLLEYDNNSDDADEITDNVNEIADNLTDVYNSDLLKWVGERQNYDFVNQAVNELGVNAENFDFINLIMQGQNYYYYQICCDVIDAINNLINKK